MHHDKQQLRWADFRTGLILIVIAVGMIGEALTYPMSDSYGGVQNVWYVSPALFPLIIGICLLLLSGVLLTIAVRANGWPGVWKRPEVDPVKKRERDRRLWAIVILIVALVFGLVPSVDFAIAGCLFLMAFITAFYVNPERLLVANTGLLAASGVTMRLMSFAGLQHDWQWIPDTGAILFVLFLTYWSWRSLGSDPKAKVRFRIAMAVALIVPMALGLIFKFGLLVPLPTEGLVIRNLEDLRYALLR